MLSWENEPNLAAMRRERAWIEIDLDALASNVRNVKAKLSPNTQFMAVVKADAYGHGAVTVARTALRAGATWLGVATIPEGIELREAGVKAPILLLGATNTPEQVRAIAEWKLQPTLCTLKQAMVFAETMAGLPNHGALPVHLKIDTGMSRLGVPWQQATELAQWVVRSPQLYLASVYSHLATADSPDPAIMNQQHTRFKAAIAHLQEAGIHPPFLHLSNSAAALTDTSLHYDLVRVGLGTYGLYPAPHLQDRVSLRPVLQVKARITQVKTVPPQTGISYGHKFITDREMAIATVGIGYADGIPRNLSNHMQVLLRGQRVPQVGAITMDQLMLDVSQIPNVQEGEVVTILGHEGQQVISADDWAETLGTISWEILCGFKHRLPRLAVRQASEPLEASTV
jgi:alanine racemase